jgi:hypothetical protein
MHADRNEAFHEMDFVEGVNAVKNEFEFMSRKIGKLGRSLWLVCLSTMLTGLQMPAAQGAETYKFYTGVRSLGMGGAYTAVVNDETSLLTNPAGLGKIRDSIITIADPEVQGSFNDTQVTNINSTSAQSPSDLLALLNQHKGLHWNAKAQAFPSIVGPNIGLGVHAKWQYDAEVDPTGTTYRYDFTNDYAAALGFCFRFFGGIVKIGGATRYIDRTEIHKDLDATVPVIDMNSTASEGTGLAGDVGIILTAPVAGFPTLAATLRDAGDTSYTMGNGMFLQTHSRPAITLQTVDVGVAFFPILSNHNRMSIIVDWHDAANANQETDMMKKLHAGLEFNFADFFFLRAGVNQRYWTSGLELSTESFQLQVASYGEEIGSQNALKEDRRWVGKFAIRF